MSVAVQEIEKARDEEDVYAIDFAADMAADETISSIVTFQVLDLAGNDVSAEFGLNDSPAPTISGQTIRFWLRNAASASVQVMREYRIYCLIRTSLNRDIEARRNDERPVIRMLTA